MSTTLNIQKFPKDRQTHLSFSSSTTYDIETNCIRYRLDGGGGDLSRQQEGHKEPEFSCLPGGVAAVTLPFSSFATYTEEKRWIDKKKFLILSGDRK